jgi:hypothetical protein
MIRGLPILPVQGCCAYLSSLWVVVHTHTSQSWCQSIFVHNNGSLNVVSFYWIKINGIVH